MKQARQRQAKRLVAVLVFELATALLAAGADLKPNFSGEWKLNIGQSDFGRLPAPKSRTDRIDHKDPSLKIIRTLVNQDDTSITVEWSCTTDGKECTSTVRGNSVKIKSSSVQWEGHTLLFDAKQIFGWNEVQIKEKWALSQDGKTITMTRHLSSWMGETVQKLVFDKQ